MTETSARWKYYNINKHILKLEYNVNARSEDTHLVFL